VLVVRNPQIAPAVTPHPYIEIAIFAFWAQVRDHGRLPIGGNWAVAQALAGSSEHELLATHIRAVLGAIQSNIDATELSSVWWPRTSVVNTPSPPNVTHASSCPTIVAVVRALHPKQ
jgi:hypothetical protein